MNPVVQQRVNMLEHERVRVIQNPGMTILGGCDRVHQQHQEEDSVFLTPKSSPGYSSDGNYSNDMGYGFSQSPSSTMGGAPGHIEASPLRPMPVQCPPPPTSTSIPFLPPGSPCEDQLCGSPYSSPYDTSSPHSIACSSPPHGSPASICTDNTGSQYPAYISPSNSIHDIPTCSSIPLTSEMSMPSFSMDNSGSIIYSNVPPTSVNGYFPSDVPPPTSQWMSPSAPLQSFNVFSQAEQAQIPHSAGHIMDGEIPVDVIDQLRSVHLESEMNHPPPQLDFYPSSSNSCSPTARQQMYDLSCMVHSTTVDLPAGGAPIPPYPVHKQSKPAHKKKPKPVVQVNDEHIKDIPTSAQLWEFTLRVLKKPAYHYMINWENRKEGLFRFHDAPAFAALWGKHRNRPNMTYDKVARALRYYYKRDILNQVGGRLTYRFSKRLGKLYASDES